MNTAGYTRFEKAEKTDGQGRRTGGRSSAKVDAKGSAVSTDYVANKGGVNMWGRIFYAGEIMAAITAVVVGSVYAWKSKDQGDETPRYGWYPLIFTVANTENYSNYDVRIGMIFFVTLAVSGGVFLVSQLLAVLAWNCSGDRKSAWSPIHKYAYDMQTMSGWYDGVRYASTFWAPYTVAFIVSGTREIPSLAYSGLLIIVTYLIRVHAGIQRAAYRDDGAEGEDANSDRKKNIRSSAALMYLTGLAVHIIIFVLMIIQFSYRLDKDIPFNSKAQGFVLLVAIGGFVEYWIVFGMRSSPMFKDTNWSWAEAPFYAAKVFSLAPVYNACDCFDEEKMGVLIGWIAHAISRGIEFTIWIAGGILMYEGAVKGIIVTA